MKSGKLLLLLGTTFLSYFSYSQDESQPSDVGYIRIQLSDLTTAEQVAAVDELISSKNGVMMSRTDRNTDTYLGYYLISSGLTETDFVTWIRSLGYSTACVVTGVRDGTPLKDFPRECYKDELENMSRTN